jgi:hypothetical protein
MVPSNRIAARLLAPGVRLQDCCDHRAQIIRSQNARKRVEKFREASALAMRPHESAHTHSALAAGQRIGADPVEAHGGRVVRNAQDKLRRGMFQQWSGSLAGTQGDVPRAFLSNLKFEI